MKILIKNQNLIKQKLYLKKKIQIKITQLNIRIKILFNIIVKKNR